MFVTCQLLVDITGDVVGEPTAVFRLIHAEQCSRGGAIVPCHARLLPIVAGHRPQIDGYWAADLGVAHKEAQGGAVGLGIGELC